MSDRSVTVRLRADIAQFQRGLASAAVSTSAFTKRLEDADSRMAMLVQTGLALAPALAPIGAAVVPALAGLTTQLGFAAVAAGTTMLAFQGVGDALDALYKFQLKPTGENLQKLNDKLDALGPAGEVFVRHLQELRGELQILQDVAQQNMLPGVSEGIESVMKQMPRFEGVIASVASTLGDLFADAGADLAGPEWSEFFDYLALEAGPILEQTGKATGNLVEGITNMVMAFDPLSDDFVTGMLEMSESSVAWSDGLDSNQGFQEFVRYVQESGPQAMETLGAIADALVEFVEAAAPVGDVVLPVLEVLADALGAVADSPAGPVIVGAAAAVGTLGRSLALLSAVGLRGGGSDTLLAKVLGTEKISASVKTLREASAATRDLSAAQRASAFAAVAQDKAVKAGLVQIGKAATAAAGLALVTSGVAESTGLSNTASMALMGTLAGPWGAAIGGGVGLMMDFAAAGDDLDAMMDRLNRTIDGSAAAFAAQRQDLIDNRAEVEALQDAVDDPSFTQNLKNAASPAFWKELAQHAHDGSALYGDEIDEINAKTNELVNAENAIYAVGLALDMTFQREDNGAISFAIEDLTAVATRAAPAMHALGLTVEDLAAMDSSELQAAAAQIVSWTQHADSAEGRTEALAEAFRQLDSDMVETATSAEILEGALESLLGPGLTLSAATDAWRSGLRNLNDELAKHSRSLTDNTDGADANREAVRKMVTSSMDLLTAQANAGVGAKQLSANLKNQRQAILDAGAAAGISKKDMNDYLNTLGLTPKAIKTIISAVTAAAENNIDRTQAKLDALRDKNIYVTTTLRTVRQGAPGPQDPSGSWAGSTVPKDGGPYTDRFPYLLAPGEEVISNRNGQADRNRSLLKAINAGRMADGGTAGDKARQAREEARRRQEERERREEEKRQRQLDRQRTKDLLASKLRDEQQQQNLEIQDARRRLRSARDAGRPKGEINELKLTLKQELSDRNAMREQERIEAKEKADEELQRLEEERIEAEKERADAIFDGQNRAWDTLTDAAKANIDAAEELQAGIKADMDQLGATATAGFRGTWFEKQAQQRGLWVGANTNGVGDWRSKANTDIAGLQERAGLIARLSDPSLGLSATALEELLGSQDNAGIAAMLAAGEVDDFAALFAQRETLLGQVSQQAGMAGYGTAYDAATAELVTLNEKFDRLTAAISAARPITVNEAYSAAATAAEIARLQAMGVA